MKIHLIWAQDYNGGIGRGGKLPWYIPEDLKKFKQLTIGATIIMGRKTWESLPKKPLPNRKNIVISSNDIPNIESYRSIKECIKIIQTENHNKIFIIGGAQIYQQFIHLSDELHITFIDKIIEGIDTYFPLSIKEIKYKFLKKEEVPLTEIAIYTRWEKYY